MRKILARLGISESEYNSIVIDHGQKFARSERIIADQEFWEDWFRSWYQADMCELDHCKPREGKSSEIEKYAKANNQAIVLTYGIMI